ncbi:MAG TPA: DNA-processing protein DprA [Bacillota bacterium]
MEVEEIQYWLRWNRVSGIGPFRFYKLLEHFGSMKDAWNAPLEEVNPIIGSKAEAALAESRNWDPQVELDKIARLGFGIYCQADPGYPSLLKQISDPPPVLYVNGSFQYGDDIALAVVGTRTPSPLGAHHARELAYNLGKQGLTIVSGMARGIDAEGHRGAMAAGARTIAVLGCGLNIAYPPEHRELMDAIAQNGAVISEFPLGTEPLATNFPARNRIISGLSLGVVVVEAAQDSGSLITAGFALEQGREVFAMPGNIGNEGSRGPHKLIRQGAKLIEDYRDILSELAIPHLSAPELAAAGVEQFSNIEQQVLAVMSREPLHIDQILRRLDLVSSQLSAILLQLEMKGAVKRFPGQLYLRIK